MISNSWKLCTQIFIWLYKVCIREGHYREVKSGKAAKLLIVKDLESMIISFYLILINHQSSDV